jgi:hypothetical protein
LQLLDNTLDNSFSSCSFWQHLQGAEPLLDSSMGCTCPPHQQHLQGSRMGRHSTAGTSTHPRLAAPSPHGSLEAGTHAADSSCQSCWTAASTHSLFSKSKLAARTKGNQRACSKGGDHSENQGRKEREKGEEFEQHYWAETFGGQQGDGRVFNTKLSKALHA